MRDGKGTDVNSRTVQIIVTSEAIVMSPWPDLDVLVVRQGGWENLVTKSVMETRCLWTVEIVFVAANVPLEIRVKLFVVALEHVTMKPVFVIVDTGEICVKIISVLESVSSVLATETVIQLLKNVSVILGGTVKTVVFQTVLVILIVTIVVIAVPTQHILRVNVMMTGQDTPVNCHVSMVHHKQTSPVYVNHVMLGQVVIPSVEDMERVMMVTVPVIQHGGVRFYCK